jgi:hypothetical protein
MIPSEGDQWGRYNLPRSIDGYLPVVSHCSGPQRRTQQLRGSAPCLDQREVPQSCGRQVRLCQLCQEPPQGTSNSWRLNWLRRYRFHNCHGLTSGYGAHKIAFSCLINGLTMVYGGYTIWLWLTVRHGIDGPNRNRCFSQRTKPPFMVGIFHGYVK